MLLDKPFGKTTSIGGIFRLAWRARRMPRAERCPRAPARAMEPVEHGKTPFLIRVVCFRLKNMVTDRCLRRNARKGPPFHMRSLHSARDPTGAHRCLRDCGGLSCPRVLLENSHMRSLAEMSLVEGPSFFIVGSLPGQVWPPPWISISDLAAIAPTAQVLRVTFMPSSVLSGRFSTLGSALQPFAFTQHRMVWSTDVKSVTPLRPGKNLRQCRLGRERRHRRCRENASRALDASHAARPA